MKYVTFIRAGDTIAVTPTNVRLVYDGKPWPHAGAWSLSAYAFEKLQEENKEDVEFNEEGIDSK